MTTIKITGEVWDLQEQCAAVINANEDVELVINSTGGEQSDGGDDGNLRGEDCACAQSATRVDRVGGVSCR